MRFFKLFSDGEKLQLEGATDNELSLVELRGRHSKFAFLKNSNFFFHRRFSITAKVIKLVGLTNFLDSQDLEAVGIFCSLNYYI